MDEFYHTFSCFVEAGRGVTMKECLNKKVTLEIISAGILQSVGYIVGELDTPK